MAAEWRRKELIGKVINSVKQLPEVAESALAKDVAILQGEHAGLSFANARLALARPIGTVRIIVRGPTSAARGDLLFVGDKATKLLVREVKVLSKPAWRTFESALRGALGKKGVPQVRGIGDEVFLQVPHGSDVLSWLKNFKRVHAAEPSKLAHLIRLQIRDPNGSLIYLGPAVLP